MDTHNRDPQFMETALSKTPPLWESFGPQLVDEILADLSGEP